MLKRFRYSFPNSSLAANFVALVVWNISCAPKDAQYVWELCLPFGGFHKDGCTYTTVQSRESDRVSCQFYRPQDSRLGSPFIFDDLPETVYHTIVGILARPFASLQLPVAGKQLLFVSFTCEETDTLVFTTSRGYLSSP
jgi:hypothetical protein